ncbi:unknown protein [Parachlamydia acanthamoebae UV-7]|uniref:Uncharacterized protein n=1 Tax=Parachlamydia acanthamoebae (strain UV7) TaxID=765952 RepID=F8KX29_PARAV|nr:unknown protein [Parachlamydia acanthamoebae UV-7]
MHMKTSTKNVLKDFISKDGEKGKGN